MGVKTDGGAPRKAHPFSSDSAMQLFAALLYGGVATGMAFINRFALLAFPLPAVVLLLQMVATLLVLYPLLLARVLDFPLFRWTKFTQLFAISALYTANTAFALFGLKAMNIPMYTTLKRLTPMTVLVIKSLWKRSWPKASLISSVALVMLGCIIAGIGDLAFDARAYTYALSSVVTQACYLLLVEFQGDAGASSTTELLWYNAITALPLLTCLAAISGDFHRIGASAAAGLAAHSTAYFYCVVLGAATMGCLLNYSMFLCTMYNSALTTTIVGVLRSVATVLLGFVFDTVPFSLVNVAGILLNTVGGVWYTYIKYSDKAAGKAGRSRVGPGGGLYDKLPKTSDEGNVGRPLLVDGTGSSGKLSVRVGS